MATDDKQTLKRLQDTQAHHKCVWLTRTLTGVYQQCLTIDCASITKSLQEGKSQSDSQEPCHQVRHLISVQQTQPAVNKMNDLSCLSRDVMFVFAEML